MDGICALRGDADPHYHMGAYFTDSTGQSELLELELLL